LGFLVAQNAKKHAKTTAPDTEMISLSEKQQLMLLWTPKTTSYPWMYNCFISFCRTWWTVELLFLWDSEHPPCNNYTEKEFSQEVSSAVHVWLKRTM